MNRSLVATVAPILILVAGALGLTRTEAQLAMPLAGPLDSLPRTLLGLAGEDIPISEAEQQAAGMDTYLFRYFVAADSSLGLSLYVGYYEAQQQGRSIHSPKNCLPGAGWEALSAGTTQVRPVGGTSDVTVNRYVLENQNRRAVVYYWYQGRGRVAWNEYAVKWDLLRDKARWGRSEEALVRVVVPVVRGQDAAADSVATLAAATILPLVGAALPAAPPSR